MQNKKLLLLLVMSSCMLMLAHGVFAQTDSAVKTNKITGNAEVNYRAKYLWRGSVFGNNYVSQPELNLAWKNFKLGFSSYFNLKPTTLSKELYTKETYFDEQDVQLVYTIQKGKFLLDAGVYNYFYFYQIGSPNTTELGFNVACNISSKISLFSQNAYGLRGYRKSFYSSIGAAYKTNIFNNTEMQYRLYSGAGNAIYNNAYFGVEKAAVTYFGNQLSCTRTIKSFYLFLMAEANLYNALVKEAAGEKGNTNFSVGIGKTF